MEEYYEVAHHCCVCNNMDVVMRTDRGTDKWINCSRLTEELLLYV